MKEYSGLGEPSITSRQDCFAALSIIVGHRDPRASAGARTVLHSLGCRKVVLARTGEELITCVRGEHGDLAVVDWELRDLTGSEAVRSLRRCHGLPARDLPVILLAPASREHAAAIAREAGADQVVRKPVTARELLAAIFAVIDAPRPFIVTEGYVGPDRRAATTPPAVEKRRRAPVRVPSLGQADGFPPSTPVIVTPDHRIKRKMGLRFLESNPAAAPAALATQIVALDGLIQLLLRYPQTEGQAVAAIRRAAESIALSAAGQGHRRIWRVARLLVTFCDRHYVTGSRASAALLEAHADTLVAVVKLGPAAAGEPGEQLVRDLAARVAAMPLR